MKPPSFGAFLALAGSWTISSVVATASVDEVSSETPQTYYVPMPEHEVFDATFLSISSGAKGPVNSRIALAVSLENTQITYDHWEDGYGPSTSTKVWGDGDASNGCAPGVDPCTDATDILKAGTSIVLESAVPVSHGTNPGGSFRYDGRDKITATRSIAMVRGSYPEDPGSLMAGGVEIFPTSSWGLLYKSPVLEDAGSSRDWLEHVALYVMAKEDDTKIYKGNTFITTLDEGESYVISSGIKLGDEVRGDKPIQVHLVTGDKGSTYELRWFAMLPFEDWSREYWSPVGDSEAQARILLYNPTTSRLDIKIDYLNSGGGQRTHSIGVNSNKFVFSPIISDGSGARIYASQDFLPLSVSDTVSSGQIYDWGFPIIPANMLTPRILVGWGYGCTHPSGQNACYDDGGDANTGNNRKARSPIWITTVADADLCVDWYGDGTFVKIPNVKKLQSRTLRKDGTNNDFDMSGAQIKAVVPNGNCADVATETVNMAAAWGQKGSYSFSGDDEALDLGTLIPPYNGILAGEITYYNPAIEIKKYAADQGSCSVGSAPGQLFDETYASSDPFFQYCYKIKVTSDDECVDGIKIKDEGVGGLGSTFLKLSEDFGLSQPLCFGDAELIIPGPTTTETYVSVSSVATVEGFGVKSAKMVTDTDGAGVTVTSWTPEVVIKKYAAAPGGCSVPKTNAMKDDSYPSPNGAFQYCYIISVPGSSQECVTDFKLLDNGMGGLGGAAIDVDGTLCPNDASILVQGPSGTSTRRSIGSTATVTGTGVWSRQTDTDIDPAGVTVDWEPEISVIKVAGPPDGSCSAPYDPSAFVDGSYLSPDGTFQYCYIIEVPQGSEECVTDLQLLDTGVGGLGDSPFDVPGTLCAGDAPKLVAGPDNITTRKTIESTVTVTGKGADSNKDVSDSDPEQVTVDFTPKVSVKKYAGPPGSSCSSPIDLSVFDDDSFFATDGTFQYCYLISVPAESEECVSNFELTDNDDGGIGQSISVGGTLCVGDAPLSATGDVSSTRISLNTTVSVVGTGVDSLKSDVASDPVEVTVDFTPNIIVKKYVVPVGSSCSVSDPTLVDDTYESSTGEFQYCYFLEVPETSEECVSDLQLIDSGDGGLGSLPFLVDGTLCVGDEPISIPAPLSSTRRNTNSPVTGFGTGVDSGKPAESSDDAGVTVDFVPKVVIKKYAGAPDGGCSSPLDISMLEDETYETIDGSFQYCYVISVDPESEECMNNFVLSDTGEGGIGSSFAVDGYLCADMDPKVITGPGDVTINSGSINSIASVSGLGADSGKEDTASDGAGVTMVGCPTGGDMDSSGSTLCPAPIEGVSVVSVVGAEGKDSDVDMLYNINIADGAKVGFKVANPFAPYEMNMFVQYRGPTGTGGWTLECDQTETSGCDFDRAPIEAACLGADGNQFTVVHVYFLPATTDIPPAFTGEGTNVDKCCHPPESTPPDSAVEYTFILRCSCPDTSVGRRLRSDTGKINVANVLATLENGVNFYEH